MKQEKADYLTIYLVCKTIDLGYHVLYALESKEQAEVKVNSLNESAREFKKEELMKNCNYSEEEADAWISSYYPYEMDETTLMPE